MIFQPYKQYLLKEIFLYNLIKKIPLIEEKIIDNKFKESLGLTNPNIIASNISFGAFEGLIDNTKKGLYINRENIKILTKLTQEEKEVLLIWYENFHPGDIFNKTGIINHELGHCLDIDFLDLSKNAVTNGILQIYEEDLNRYTTGDSNFLSKYSFISEDEFENDKNNPDRFKEFVAEAISEYLTSSTPKTVACLVWDIVVEELKKRY